nr:hypothetical protein GCM10020092_033540 [Actinoplanes digitatis]
MLKPPPVMPAVAPTPTIDLSDATSYMPYGRAIVPLTQMVRGSVRPIAPSSSAAVSTATVAPPAPPVVPLRPSAFTVAKPVGAPATRQSPGSGGEVGGVVPVGSGPGAGVSTTTSSKVADA